MTPPDAPSAVEIDVEVEDPAWDVAVDGAAALVERAARAALRAGPDAAGAICVLLADDDAVRALNARFRGRDAPTNVLAFPAAAAARPLLGDIALAFGTCAAEAAAQGKSLADHLSHLVVHGVLHLLGRDHLNAREAEAMEAEERAVLGSLGIADPYAGEPR